MPAISNVDSYIKIVKEKYQTRRLIEAARQTLEQAVSEPDADMLLESAEQKLYDIRGGQDKSGVKSIRESILEVIDTMQKLSGADRSKYAGIPTGFNYLDTVLTGLGRSDLIILAARPGMGKTSFALNIATNVARQQKVPTIIFSLEMTCEQLTDRILSSVAGIDSQAFRTGRLNNSDWNDFATATSLLYNVPIYMDDSSGISVPEIKAKIRQINQDPKREPIGLVIIDYLQLMQSAKRTESRVQEISDITRNLKIMAKELNVPVIALSQLSRAAEKTTGRSDHRPQLSDLRDSGSIEQDADVVLFFVPRRLLQPPERRRRAGQRERGRVHRGQEPPRRDEHRPPWLGRRAHTVERCVTRCMKNTEPYRTAGARRGRFGCARPAWRG